VLCITEIIYEINIVARYMHYYILFLDLDRDTTLKNILKCSYMQSRYAANTSLNFFVWSLDWLNY